MIVVKNKYEWSDRYWQRVGMNESRRQQPVRYIPSSESLMGPECPPRLCRSTVRNTKRPLSTEPLVAQKRNGPDTPRASADQVRRPTIKPKGTNNRFLRLSVNCAASSRCLDPLHPWSHPFKVSRLIFAEIDDQITRARTLSIGNSSEEWK